MPQTRPVETLDLTLEGGVHDEDGPDRVRSDLFLAPHEGVISGLKVGASPGRQKQMLPAPEGLSAHGSGSAPSHPNASTTTDRPVLVCVKHQTCRCRCDSVLQPVFPERPRTCPLVTVWPALTSRARQMHEDRRELLAVHRGMTDFDEPLVRDRASERGAEDGGIGAGVRDLTRARQNPDCSGAWMPRGSRAHVQRSARRT